MATIDTDNQMTHGSGNSAKEEAILIADIMKATEDRDVTYDGDADAFERTPIIPFGVYGVKLFTPKEGWKQHNFNGEVNYSCVVDAKLADVSMAPASAAGFEGITIDWMLSTTIPRGKKTSTMATVCAKMGIPVTKMDKVLRLAQGFTKWLQKEPLVYVEIDWKAAYKPTEDGKWVNLYWSSEQFPKGDDGEPLERFELQSGPAKGRVISAIPYIARVYGKIDAVPNERKHRSGASSRTATVSKPSAPVVKVAAAAVPSLEDEFNSL